MERTRRERTRTRRESWKTKMTDPPDLSTWSFTADTRPVRVLLALDSAAVQVSSAGGEMRARSALIGPEKMIWRRRTTMEARTAYDGMRRGCVHKL
jgi:hypothetical protein